MEFLRGFGPNMRHSESAHSDCDCGDWRINAGRYHPMWQMPAQESPIATVSQAGCATKWPSPATLPHPGSQQGRGTFMEMNTSILNQEQGAPFVFKNTFPFPVKLFYMEKTGEWKSLRKSFIPPGGGAMIGNTYLSNTYGVFNEHLQLLSTFSPTKRAALPHPNDTITTV